MDRNLVLIAILLSIGLVLMSCGGGDNSTPGTPGSGGTGYKKDQPTNLTSCKGNCGVTGRSGCHCDSQCLKYNDCCPDYLAECKQQCLQVISPVCGSDNKTYENRCIAERTGATISCVGECPCASSTNASESCKGSCGKQTASGCYCDPRCIKYKDCCTDYTSECT